MPKKFLTPILCVLFLAALDPAEPKAADQELALDSIRVTAQKREEDVQEIPASINVIGERAIEEKGIRQFQDLHTLVPNMTITSSGGGATYTYMGIRGRVNSSGGDIDPTVTVMLDGVPFDDFYSVSSLPLFDIERIEVLRGPQSTLYGLNSEAGVINIITNKPGPEPRARFGLTMGSGRNSDISWGVQGSVSAPVVQDRLSVGLSFSGSQDGSYIKNNLRDDDYGESRRSGVRFSTVLTPNEAFEATLNVGYSQLSANNGYLALPIDASAAGNIDWPGFGKWEVYIDYPEYSKVNNFTSDLTMRLKTGPADIVSITGWRRTDQRYGTDFDLGSQAFGPFGMYGVVDSRYRTFIQELRVMSPEDRASSLEWLLGLFYRDSRREGNMAGGSTLDGVPVSYQPMVESILDLRDFAVFGQATYRILDDRLGLTLGLRQEWTRRKLTDRLYFVGERLEKKDSQFIPKFSIDYRLTPDNMIYATVAKGWRPGSYYNVWVPQVFPFPSSDEIKFEKETSWTYEIGSKNTFFDNKFMINISTFYTKYNGYQDQYIVDMWTSYFYNVGKAEVYGLEIESIAELNDYISVNLGFGYIKPTYKEYKDLSGEYSGNIIAGVARFNANLGLNFRFLDGFYIAPEVRIKGKTYWDRTNLYSQNTYSTLHLRLGYVAEHWELYLFGDNLTNKYALQKGLPMAVSTDMKYGVPTKPLQVGLGFNFYY
ncbi:MAG: TonB-dependent receptor [Deltaproteobacteria bacterium]|jgi:iron complex outermembrane receptor protein|nr:TonB-dependent receptor [Deltaproteobacteria bacterium]